MSKKKPAKSKPGTVRVKYEGAKAHSITPFLMFNANPEEAAQFYVSIFKKKSRILRANPKRASTGNHARGHEAPSGPAALHTNGHL